MLTCSLQVEWQFVLGSALSLLSGITKETWPPARARPADHELKACTFVYQIQRFCQRNLLWMLALFPRKNDVSFVLSTCGSLSWLMVVRDWHWPGTYVSLGKWVVAPTQEGCSMEDPERSQPPCAWDCPLAFPLILHLFSKHWLSHSALPIQFITSTYQNLPFLWFSHTALSLACFDLLSGFLSFFLALCSLGPAPLFLMVIVPGPTCFERLPRHN